MENNERDWIAYVQWKTIADWKYKMRKSAARGCGKVIPQREGNELNEYPFQYASKQSRFMNMSRGDNLWLVSLPQFEGYCQAPSIMARLHLDAVYDRMQGCPVEVSRHSDGFGRYLAVGRPVRVIDTYPPLYNIFDVLIKSEFEGKVKDLRKYKDWLEQGEFGARGPYYRLAQHFRTLRQFTQASGERLRRRHQIAVDGRRAFISYKVSDLHDRSVGDEEKKHGWPKLLVDILDKLGIMIWWDGQQMLGRSSAWDKQADLISALLDDGVKQAAWFVALGTDGYGSPGYSGRNWTFEEWEAAGIEATNMRRRGMLRRLLIEFGGNGISSLLPGRSDDIIKHVTADAGAEDVALVIAKVINSEGKKAN
ncbi:MAG: hypothetical protein PVG41_04050 [Desulfobacteraceae bacterium]|jgi:hypothetical protein